MFVRFVLCFIVPSDLFVWMDRATLPKLIEYNPTGVLNFDLAFCLLDKPNHFLMEVNPWYSAFRSFLLLQKTAQTCTEPNTIPVQNKIVTLGGASESKNVIAMFKEELFVFMGCSQTRSYRMTFKFSITMCSDRSLF